MARRLNWMWNDHPMSNDVMLDNSDVVTFHDYDPAKYAEVKCVLCHGSSAKAGNFTMPNPELPKLSTKPADMKKLHETSAKMVEFMAKTVVPTMAALSTLWLEIDRLGLTVKKNRTRRRTASP